tara:strand:+ start:23 stop:1624 length:1602 start_codon:yes stop_codon:yes gene_type:complete
MAIIYTYPTKQNPQINDLVLISDASDGNKTKNATISSLQSAVSGVSSINSMTGDIILNAGSNLSVTTTASSGSVTYDLNPAVVISSSLSLPDGTVTSPSLRFTSDAETGIYKTNSGFGVTVDADLSIEFKSESVNVPTKLKIESIGSNTEPAIEIEGGAGIYSSQNTNATTSYTVTVVQDAEGNNVFALNGVQQPEIDLIYGQTYTFNWSAVTAGNHAFGFVKSSTRDPNKPSTTPFTDGVTVNGTTTTITISHQGGPRIFYACTNHAGMGGLVKLRNTHNLNFSIDDKAIAILDGRNNNISGTTSFGNGLQFGTDGNVLNDYETGIFYPWVEVCNYDQQNAVNNWSSWGGSEDSQWYNASYASYGYYTKIGNLVQISFRAYPLNQSTERFMCNGIRIKLPFVLSTGSLAKGFTGTLGEGKANAQGIDGGWISGSYLYMLISQVGLTETTTPNTYDNFVNNGLTNEWTDNDGIIVTGTPGQSGCTTTAVDDKFRHPSSYWSTYGRATRYSFRANSYSTFSFGGSAYVTGYTSY